MPSAALLHEEPALLRASGLASQPPACLPSQVQDRPQVKISQGSPWSKTKPRPFDLHGASPSAAPPCLPGSATCFPDLSSVMTAALAHPRTGAHIERFCPLRRNSGQ